jgi:ankyrin repeat protein
MIGHRIFLGGWHMRAIEWWGLIVLAACGAPLGVAPASASCPDWRPPLVPTVAEARASDLCKGTPYEKRVEELKVATPEADARREADAGRFQLLRSATPFDWEGHICTVPYPYEGTVSCGLEPARKPQTADRDLYLHAYRRLIDPDRKADRLPVQCATVLGALLADYAGRYNKAILDHPRYPHKDLCTSRDPQRQLTRGEEDAISKSATARPPESLRPADYPDLPTAARFGDVAAVKRLILAGAKLDASDDFRLTALEWTIIREYREMFLALADAGVRGEQDYCRPWSYALGLKRGWAIERLRASCIRQATPSSRRNFLINEAARNGNIALLRAFAAEGAPLTGDAPKGSGRQAPDGDYYDAMTYPPSYLLFGGDFDEDKASCPLHVAARRGNLDTVAYLLSMGISAESSCSLNNRGRPIYWAILGGSVKTIELLVQNGASLTSDEVDTPVHYAVSYRKRDVLAALQRLGSDIDAVDHRGYPASLMILRSPFYGNGLEMLLELGANPNARSSEPEAATQSKSHPNSRLRLPGSSRRTALMHAILTSRLTASGEHWHLGPLPDDPLPAQVDPKLPDDATLSSIKPVRMLLAAGADPKLADSLGFTPLHYVARTDYGVEVAGALLDGGADVNSRDVWGRTPLDHALDLGLERMPALLRARGGKRSIDLRP